MVERDRGRIDVRDFSQYHAFQQMFPIGSIVEVCDDLYRFSNVTNRMQSHTIPYGTLLHVQEHDFRKIRKRNLDGSYYGVFVPSINITDLSGIIKTNIPEVYVNNFTSDTYYNMLYRIIRMVKLTELEIRPKAFGNDEAIRALGQKGGWEYETY